MTVDDNTVSLYTQRQPYTEAQRRKLDPGFDHIIGFLLMGPYIFAQRSDSGTMHLYVSYNRQPFNLAKIPSTVPHVVSL